MRRTAFFILTLSPLALIVLGLVARVHVVKSMDISCGAEHVSVFVFGIMVDYKIGVDPKDGIWPKGHVLERPYTLVQISRESHALLFGWFPRRDPSADYTGIYKKTIEIRRDMSDLMSRGMSLDEARKAVEMNLSGAVQETAEFIERSSS